MIRAAVRVTYQIAIELLSLVFPSLRPVWVWARVELAAPPRVVEVGGYPVRVGLVTRERSGLSARWLLEGRDTLEEPRHYDADQARDVEELADEAAARLLAVPIGPAACAEYRQSTIRGPNACRECGRTRADHRERARRTKLEAEVRAALLRLRPEAPPPRAVIVEWSHGGSNAVPRLIEVVDAGGQRAEVGEREWEALRTDPDRLDLDLPPWTLRATPAAAANGSTTGSAA